MKDEIVGGDKGRGLPVDPNLPRWLWQNCRSQASSVQGSVMGYSRMDHSYVVFAKQRTPGHGVPPRPRSGATHSDRGQSTRAMEESYVVLPPAAASMYKSEPLNEGGGPPTPALLGDSPSSPLQANNSGFHSTITVLKRAFDIATAQTQVEQPLCLECMRILSDRLDKEVENVNRDIKAYEACLQRFELESCFVIEFSLILLFNYVISNFYLSSKVEWDEINVAWGQACLLLHTMAQYFLPKFQYRIKFLPMGSYPRIMDSNNNTYELFGPVNLFWSTRYDRAMTLYLTCLKEFAEFACLMDQENNIPPGKCFKLPYLIDNDKVGGLTITQSFNKQENWTKALKCTMCNLKWVLYWFIGNNDDFQPLYTMALSPAQVQAIGSVGTKQPSESKS
ncbi:hypothetical protein J5N97_017665 [Dioscorea zingiberensis]|uniref:Atg6 BARA domain-containing protein n=1 Tax=Dioscorea zingiberensis TaxID=325984 RepID=A0A9D5CPJ4_9LILI|nr:hypothetical protein J5N97_017665 [Dioscorea zingiberensis]